MNMLDRLHMKHRFWRYRQRKEANEIRFMQAQALSGKTVIDIGANRGVYTYWLSAAVGKTGQVIAFEPQPELQQHLADLIKSFNLKNIHLVNTGLSNCTGKVKLYRNKIGSGDASSIPEPGWQAVNVQRQTLDSFILNHSFKSIAYIKCDVEGHELEVMQGAVETIQRDKPILQIECHDKEAREGGLFRLVTSLGYDGFFFHNKQQIHYSKFALTPHRKPETDHRNYIFLYNGSS